MDRLYKGCDSNDHPIRLRTIARRAQLVLKSIASQFVCTLSFSEMTVSRVFFLCFLVWEIAKACQSCSIDFENGDLDGWTMTGTAFKNQPTYGDNPTARKRGQPANQQGNWWIGSYEDRPCPKSKAGLVIGDGPKGTLTSPPFYIVERGEISFLIGGGCNIVHARAELIINGQVVKKATGKCNETMESQTWDLHQYLGKQARLRLVDTGSKGWGHINFDYLHGDICCDYQETHYGFK